MNIQRDPPLVSVIVPMFNGRKTIAAVLDGLLAQNYPSDQIEIIVVDNDSDDGGDQIVHGYPNVKLLHEPKKGSYRARNTGIKNARGAILAFLDADCIPVTGWLFAGVTAIQEMNAAMAQVGGPITVFPETGIRETAAELLDMAIAFRVRRYFEEEHFFVTANMMVTKETITHAGSFNGDLISGGDKEFSQRATRAGATLQFCETMLAYHPARATAEALRAKIHRLETGAYHLDVLSGGRSARIWACRLFLFLIPPIYTVNAVRKSGIPHDIWDLLKIGWLQWKLKLYRSAFNFGLLIRERSRFDIR